MKYKWEPNKESVFTGHIHIKIGTAKERRKILKDINFAIKKKKVEEQEGEMEKVELLEERVRESVLDVSLKVKGSKEVIEDFDDLSIFTEGTAVIYELGNVLLNGIRLGKN